MARAVRYLAALVAVLGACSDDATSTPEVVIENASLGGTVPQILGATSTSLFWTASPTAASTLVGGAALASLPAQGSELASGSGRVAHAGEFAAFVADGAISRVDTAGTVQRVTRATPEALAANAAEMPVVAWTVGATVSWGVDDAQQTATFTKVDSCDHVRVSAHQIYVAADGASGRRLLRIDPRTAMITPMTSSSTWGPMFPGGVTAGATYRGRIVDADDDRALWLVEEMPGGRGIVVSEPVQGEASVLLEHISNATGFFASPTALFWQEGDELLSAPRAGGAASIVATLPGPAGAVADGYVYFVDGSSIARLRVE
jgi:hypothetical protein